MFGGGLPQRHPPDRDKAKGDQEDRRGRTWGAQQSHPQRHPSPKSKARRSLNQSEKPEPGGADFWPSSGLTPRPLCFLIGETVTVTSAWERPDQGHCAQPSGSFWCLVFARTVSLWSRGRPLPSLHQCLPPTGLLSLRLLLSSHAVHKLRKRSEFKTGLVQETI